MGFDFCSARDRMAAALLDLPGFAWRIRMASVWVQRPEHGGHRITFTAGDGAPIGAGTSYFTGFQPELGRWILLGPDLDDPATQGCLFAWLVELRGGLVERALESLEDEDWLDADVHFGEALAQAIRAVFCEEGVPSPSPPLGARLLAWARASGAPVFAQAVVAAKLSWGGWELLLVGLDGVGCVGRLQVSTHPKVEGVVCLEEDPGTVEELVDALEAELALRAKGAL